MRVAADLLDAAVVLLLVLLTMVEAFVVAGACLPSGLGGAFAEASMILATGSLTGVVERGFGLKGCCLSAA